eukprot:875991-Pelagomonas_calceolata.AAC.2
MNCKIHSKWSYGNLSNHWRAAIVCRVKLNFISWATLRLRTRGSLAGKSGAKFLGIFACKLCLLHPWSSKLGSPKKEVLEMHAEFQSRLWARLAIFFSAAN